MAQSEKKTRRVIDISKVYLNELNTWSNVYDEMEKGYHWLAGVQYTKEQESYYDQIRRPHNVFNLIFPHVNTLLGEILEQDDMERVFPKGRSDPQLASTLQDILDHIYTSNDEEAAFLETVLAGLCKMGFEYPRFSAEKDLDGSIVITNTDEFEILFDSRSKDYFLDDAAYVGRSRWLIVDQILRLWPEHRGELKSMLRDRKESKYFDEIGEEGTAMMNHKDFVNEKEGQYRVIEFHEMEWQDAEVAYDPITRERRIWTLSGERADEFLRANPNTVIIESNEKVKKVTKIIPGLNFLLEEKEADIQDGQYDYVPFFAYHYGVKTIDNFGIFKNAFGPQMEFNEWHNRTADIINKSAAPAFAFRPGQVHNPNQLKNYGSMPGLAIEVKDEAQSIEDVFKQYQPAGFPAAADRMSMETLELLPKILGITQNQMGQEQTKQENASLFAQRVRQAVKAMAVIYRNISRTKKRRSDKVLRLIQHYYNKPRVINILVKKDMTQKEVFLNLKYGDRIINDVSVGEYHVIMDDLERNPTARALRFMMKNELAQLVVAWYGPTALDPEWWLEDADLGDIKELIARINQSIATQIQAAQEAEAFGAAGEIIELANKRAGTPGERAEFRAEQ